MSDYKIGEDAAIRVTVGDVGMGGQDGKYPDRNPVLQIEFAVVGAVYGNSGSRVSLADPYIESGIADVDAVLPWPDAERMALLEALVATVRNLDAPMVEAIEFNWCAYCHKSDPAALADHEPDCEWRLLREAAL
jgi:hypothetical protein